ncbi:MAG: glycosyltransferase [Verrucomicrobiota bacterium]
MSEPLVSVIMPAYQAAPYIEACVSSVLEQSYTKFELIIINDGSTDQTDTILKKIDDPRLRLVSSDKNKGYTHRLREALAMAKGKYIARLDADDRCHRDRLESQVRAFEQDENLVLCGSSCRLIDGQGKIIGEKHHPTDERLIQWVMLLDNPLQHPSVMIRKSVLDDRGINFNPDYEPTEDFKLWSDLSRTGKVVNLSDLLIDYRIHAEQVSRERRQRQLQQHDRVVMENLEPYEGVWQHDEAIRQGMRELEQGSSLSEIKCIEAESLLKAYLELYSAFDQGQKHAAVTTYVAKRVKRLWNHSKTLSERLIILRTTIQQQPGVFIEGFFI